MVCHMGKIPLVEVLGSFTSNTVVGHCMQKHQVISYGNDMHIDTGIKFSMNSVTENFTRKFPVILLVPVVGCPCTQEIDFSKIPVA